MLNAAGYWLLAAGSWPRLHLYLRLLLLLLLPLRLISQDSLNVRMIGRWSDPSLPGSFLYDNTYNACWGYVRDGREYGIIGSTMGTHIIDVTDPATAHPVAFVPGAVQGGDVVHREYKTYRDRLYAVTDEGQGTLQIIDLRYLPDSVVVNYDSHALFYRAHSLGIDTSNARLYTHGGSSDFAIWSLADPDSPTLLLKPELSVPWWSNVGYVHDAYTIDNVTYTNDVDGMHIIDFTNLSSPQLIGSLTNLDYPQPGYNHSGWLNDNGWLYVMADETHGTDLKLFDVSVPSSIEFIDTVGTDLGPGSIPHNPVFQGDLLHVAWYEDGYWLWSVADPYNAQLLGFYDTHPEPYSFSYKGAWGVYPFLPSGHILVSDMQRGLYVLDISTALSIATPKSDEEDAVRIWPTITEGLINIAADHHRTFNVQVFDALGRQPNNQQPTTNNGILDLRAMPDGLYIIRVTSGDHSSAQRIIKTSER